MVTFIVILILFSCKVENLQKVVELWDIGDDGEFVRDVTVNHVLNEKLYINDEKLKYLIWLSWLSFHLRVKQAWDAQAIFGNLVRQGIILQDIFCPVNLLV